MGKHNRASFAICLALFLLVLIPCAIEFSNVVKYHDANIDFLGKREIHDFSNRDSNKTAFAFSYDKYGDPVVKFDPLSDFSKYAKAAVSANSKAWSCVLAAITLLLALPLFVGGMLTFFTWLDGKITWWFFGWLSLFGSIIGFPCMAAGVASAKNAEDNIIATLRKTNTAPVSEVPHYTNIIPWYVFVALLAFHIFAISVAYYCVRKVSFKRPLKRAPTLESQTEPTQQPRATGYAPLPKSQPPPEPIKMTSYTPQKADIDFTNLRREVRQKRQQNVCTIRVDAHNAGFFGAKMLLEGLAENSIDTLSDDVKEREIKNIHRIIVKSLGEKRLLPSSRYDVNDVMQLVRKGFEKACEVYSKSEDDSRHDDGQEIEEIEQSGGNKKQGNESDWYSAGYEAGKSCARHVKTFRTERISDVRETLIKSGMNEAVHTYGKPTDDYTACYNRGFEDAYADGLQEKSSVQQGALSVFSDGAQTLV
ncbi:MAG: hypothetical protein ABW189_03585 [Rickettsiales bacterium]